MDSKNLVEWLDSTVSNKDFLDLIEDTSNNLMALLGDPDLSLGEDLYSLKSTLLYESFKSNLGYEMYIKPTIKFIDDEGLPDPADIEEDESEEDACIVSDLVNDLREYFEMSSDLLYMLIYQIYYKYDRVKIRNDRYNRDKEEVIKDIILFVRNIN